MSMQMGNLPGPPNMNPPATAPGANGPQSMYQSDPSMSLGQAGAGAPPPHEFSYAQPAETSH
ncbi:hypothetical protein KSP39_PZI005454 [Platanthera zijinensis]|uniref:Uncharacterized protein n=1 Tax=Platanthera zijinensis TaxID=2320716 RepID=A0AAP0BSZ6_9ASPA